MAHQIRQNIQEILDIPENEIIKKDYGPNSLIAFKPSYDSIIETLKFIQKFTPQVPRQINDSANNSIQSILNFLVALQEKKETDYVKQKDQLVKSINNEFSNILTFLPHYVSAGILQNSLLENSEYIKDLGQSGKVLEKATAEALDKIKELSNDIIKDAKAEADGIISAARDTAAGTSITDAQTQFQTGANNNRTNIWVWATISIVAILAFFGFLWYLLSIDVKNLTTQELIYKSVIRLAGLGIVGTVIAYSLRILRSHLHMQQHNLHRKRLANSMGAITESISDANLRNRVLSILVEALADFGNSGMISKEDESNSKITVDSITSTLGKITGGD